jgi:hypothetical protein
MGRKKPSFLMVLCQSEDHHYYSREAKASFTFAAVKIVTRPCRSAATARSPVLAAEVPLIYGNYPLIKEDKKAIPPSPPFLKGGGLGKELQSGPGQRCLGRVSKAWAVDG